jgi:hypothetical protein
MILDMDTTNIGWHSTLAHNIAIVACDWSACLSTADRSVAKFLGDVSREWRVMVKDVRFTFYGGVDSPERQRAYVARRLAEYRRGIAAYRHRPTMLALDEALEAVELEAA